MLHNRSHIQLTVQHTLKYIGYYKKSCLKTAMTLSKLTEIRISEICEVTRHAAGLNLLIYCLNNKSDKFFIESLNFYYLATREMCKTSCLKSNYLM